MSKSKVQIKLKSEMTKRMERLSTGDELSSSPPAPGGILFGNELPRGMVGVDKIPKVSIPEGV